MKKVISVFIVLAIASMAILSSCKKDEEKEVEYETYSVQYLLTNNMTEGKRFIITYKDPAFANKITEQYESIKDTFWIRLEAKSLDVLYLSGETKNDTADYSVSIFVDSKLMVFDSTACSWECEKTFVEIDYPLP